MIRQGVQMLMDFNPEVSTISPSENLQGRFDNIDHLCTFLFAGNSTITLRSVQSLTRFTYRVRKPENQQGSVEFFVSLLNGPDNESNYSYLGHIFKDSRAYCHGRKSKIGVDAPSARAFEWFYKVVIETKTLSPKVEVWHEGRCGRCNRKLTVPTSIASGIGPECAKLV